MDRKKIERKGNGLILIPQGQTHHLFQTTCGRTDRRPTTIRFDEEEKNVKL